jgi:putative tryptophan/tyrosine transport system substrate-binding protein
MRRREFITLASGAVAALPFAARAQQSGKMWQVGYLYPGPQAVAPSRIASFLSGLRAGGLPAEQVVIIPRVTDGDPALLGPMATDLVGRKVDLIYAISPAAVRAARAVTSSIPIVAGDLESDPIGSGFIATHRQPGGNITGVFLDFPDFCKKWLETLKEAVPQISTVALLWEPTTGPHQRQAVEAAAAQFGLKVTVLEVRTPDDIERALQSAVGQGARGLIALSSPFIAGNTKLLADLALKYRLPAITLFNDFPRDGGLMAYGPDIRVVARQAGVIAAKILLGASPAETPIETPTRLEFVLNLKTAQLLGIVIPASTLLRADEVIE